VSSGITETDNIAYVGQVPWHSLGTEVAEGATIEEMRDAASLGWKIGVASQFFEVDGVRYGSPDRIIYREDTKDILDTVGPDYIPAQNDEVLEFFREYLATGDMTLNTAGSLWGGRYVWGLAKLKVAFELAGGDQVTGYLLVANANKYGRGLIVKFVMERVVCHNTLTIALNETGRQISIAHNRKFDADARQDAKLKLGLAMDTFASLEKEATVFSKTALEEVQVNRVLGATFDLEVAEDEQPVKENRKFKRVKELYLGAGIGADLESAKGTAWGVLNAVTQYVDHEYGRGADKRLRHAWFEGGEVVKRRARQAIWKEAAKNGGATK
jgi:phage/plasmid-like protein (TIGR03299 family)